MTITLTDSAAEFVESQVTEGGYESVNEYFAYLVRQAQKRKAREKLEALLLEGLNSPRAEDNPNWISDIKKRLIEQYGGGKNK